MTMTFDKFLTYCEENDLETGIEISNQLIDAFIISNPHMKWMARPDWLKVAIETYNVVIDDRGIILEPFK